MINRRLIFLGLRFAAAVIVCFCVQGCSRVPANIPKASDGKLDLKDWSFERDGSLRLDGEWKFRWEEDRRDFALPDFDDSTWSNIKVPGYWNKTTRSSTGYGWLRLTVMHVFARNPALYLENSLTAYDMYVNGSKVLSNGVAGNSRSTSLPEKRPGIAAIAQSEKLVIAWKISNFSDANGGPVVSPRLGAEDEIRTDLWMKDLSNCFVIGFILMMAIYHLFLWFAGNREKANIFFACFYLFIILRTLCTENLLSRVFPRGWTYGLLVRAEIFSIPLIVLALSLFIHALFPKQFTKQALVVICIVSAAGLFIPCVTDTLVFTGMLPVYQFFSVVVGAWVMATSLRAVKSNPGESIIILCGLFVVFVCLLNDILFNHLIIRTTYLIQSGVLIFSFCQSVILSVKFTESYKTARHLSTHLKDEVERQTKTIERQNLELLRSNDELQALNREKSNFLATISHEFLNPLTMIRSPIEAIMKEQFGKTITATDTVFPAIHRNIVRLQRLINNILDSSRNELIGLKPVRESADIVGLVKECVSQIVAYTTVKRMDLTFTNNTPYDAIIVLLDQRLFESAIHNLLWNALKFTPQGGSIRVEIDSDEHAGKVSISVIDTGIGLPDDKLEAIFVRFMRIRNGGIEGAGLGLSLVKEIIEAHEGAVSVSSFPGKGSKFTVMLPVKKFIGMNKVAPIVLPGQGRKTARSEKKPEAPPARRSPKDTILIVDDDEDLIDFFERIFSSGYEILKAHNGIEGLAILKSSVKPALIVSDIVMPDMDGREFLDRVAAEQSFRDIPFIYLTALAEQAEKIVGLNKGAIDYIVKPFDFEELEAKMDRIIAYSRYLGATSAGGTRRALDEQKDSLYRDYGLTPREQEVVELLLAGKSQYEISIALNIVEKTAAHHIENIYEKTGVHGRFELFGLVIRL